MPEINLQSKLPEIGTSIFTIMSKMAADYKAINLAQGFSDFNCSDELIELVNHYQKKGRYRHKIDRNPRRL